MNRRVCLIWLTSQIDVLRKDEEQILKVHFIEVLHEKTASLPFNVLLFLLQTVDNPRFPDIFKILQLNDLNWCYFCWPFSLAYQIPLKIFLLKTTFSCYVCLKKLKSRDVNSFHKKSIQHTSTSNFIKIPRKLKCFFLSFHQKFNWSWQLQWAKLLVFIDAMIERLSFL